MWSGPRNISTAMMRSWGNRPDTFVCDEPLYAHYLVKSGRPHPGRDEVIASQQNDWRRVVSWLAEFDPPGKRVFYQKQMTHHLLPEVERSWIDRVENAFLIRSPRAVIASFARVIDRPALEDTGFPQQLEIFEEVRRRTGRTPPVVDAADVVADPAGTLRLLCEALGVAFTGAMLSWPAGPRMTDGVWAKHWYDAVVRSTSFERPESSDLRAEALPEHLAALLPRAEEIYAQIHPHRLRATH